MIQKRTGAKVMLSVAMCTYNGELYLQQQLLSIAKQTRLPDELVVCDDGSTDATLQILDEFQEMVPFPVKIYCNETRLGPIKNFEKAITLCAGDVIALSDQDDVWMPNKLERLERMLGEHPEAGYVFSDGLVVDEMLNPLGYKVWDLTRFTTQKRRHFQQGHQIAILLKHNVAIGATLAFRAELQDFVLPIPREWGHDEWIAIILSAIGRKGVFIEEPLFYYRQHPKQVVGGRKLGFYEKVRQTLTLRVKTYGHERNRYLQLLNHLLSVGIVNRSVQELVEGKIQHLGARQLLYESPRLKRIKIVLKELQRGRYHKFSSGWKSVAKDLCRVVLKMSSR